MQTTTVSAFQCIFLNVETVLKGSCNLMINRFSDNLMQANPSKFQGILFGPKVKENLQLSESITKDVVICVKLLGVDTDKKLNFSSHIAHICEKEGKHCFVLRRLSNVLTSGRKLMLFKCYILAHFNFHSTLRHFCSMLDIRKMEKSQENSLCIVYNDVSSSYSELLPKSRSGLSFL